MLVHPIDAVSLPHADVVLWGVDDAATSACSKASPAPANADDGDRGRDRRLVIPGIGDRAERRRCLRTSLFISHNLALVRHISTRIAVTSFGRIVEIAAADALFERPFRPNRHAGDRHRPPLCRPLCLRGGTLPQHRPDPYAATR